MSLADPTREDRRLNILLQGQSTILVNQLEIMKHLSSVSQYSSVNLKERIKWTETTINQVNHEKER